MSSRNMRLQVVMSDGAAWLREGLTAAKRHLGRRILHYVILAIVLTAGAVYAANLSQPAPSNKKDPQTGGTSQENLGLTRPATNGKEDNVHSTPQSTSSGSTNTNTITVTVNGQNITVPDNGHTNQVITDDGGTAQVSISHSSSSTGNNNSSSLNLSVHSSSSDREEGGP